MSLKMIYWLSMGGVQINSACTKGGEIPVELVVQNK